MNIHIVCLLGRGGSGKDTQADLITQPLLLNGQTNDFYVPHAVKISTGDLVRGALDPNNPLYEKYNTDIAPYTGVTQGGKLIPNEIILSLAEQELAELLLHHEKSLFIFTGFPRTHRQLAAFDNWTDDLRLDVGVQTQFVSFFVPEQLSRDRARTRRELALSQSSVPRKDDREDVVGTRLAEFKKFTQLMLNELFEQNRLTSINAARDILSIQHDMRKVLYLEKRTDTEGLFISHEHVPVTHNAWRK